MSGKEALKLIKIAHENNMSYKMIFTDFSMPEMDGIQLTRNIRKMFADPKSQPIIIGVTGH